MIGLLMIKTGANDFKKYGPKKLNASASVFRVSIKLLKSLLFPIPFNAFQSLISQYS